MKCLLQIIFLSLCVSGLQTGCSSGETSVSPASQDTRVIDPEPVSQMFAFPIQVRRPKGNVVDPKAIPGGEDYESKIKPNANYDCEEPETLYQGWDLSTLMNCLDQTVKTPLTLRYMLLRKAQPELKLSQEDLENPQVASCVKELLLKIPVPREVFFVNEGVCRASRISIEADRVLGLKWPKDQLIVRITLPLSPKPESQGALIRTLLGWSLTPFFGTDQRIQSKKVSDFICKRCMGEEKFEDALKNMNKERPELPVWP